MGRLHGPVVGGVVQIDQRVKFNQEVQSGILHPWGNVWYVDGDNGNTAYNGRGASQSKALPSQAIAAASDNDFIYLKAADYTESAALVLSLNDVQIIGVAPNPMQPHLDIWMEAAGGGFSPQITVSGKGNSFYNLCFRHGAEYTSGVGYAGDLTCMKVSGRYNYFENIYFYSPIYGEQDLVNSGSPMTGGYAGVEITGHNNYFKGCKFGSDGLYRDKVNWNLFLHNGIGNVFEDCIFQMSLGGTTPLFIHIASQGRDMKAAYFRNCTFYAHSANYDHTLADAFTIEAGGNTAAVVFDSRCNFVNVAEICDANNDHYVWKPVVDRGATEASAETLTETLIARKDAGA